METANATPTIEKVVNNAPATNKNEQREAQAAQASAPAEAPKVLTPEEQAEQDYNAKMARRFPDKLSKSMLVYLLHYVHGYTVKEVVEFDAEKVLGEAYKGSAGKFVETHVRNSIRDYGMGFKEGDKVNNAHKRDRAEKLIAQLKLRIPVPASVKAKAEAAKKAERDAQKAAKEAEKASK